MPNTTLASRILGNVYEYNLAPASSRPENKRPAVKKDEKKPAGAYPSFARQENPENSFGFPFA